MAVAAGVAVAVVAGGVVVAAAVSHKHSPGKHPVAARRVSPTPPHAAGLPGDIVFLTSGASVPPKFLKIHEISPYGAGDRLLPIGGAVCCSSPALSPDGTKVVYTGEGIMSVTDVKGHPASGLWSPSPGPLVTPTGEFLDPTWSPSGKQIAFIFSPGKSTGQSPEIDVINADGTGRRALSSRAAR